MKICTKCKTPKDESEFNKKKTGKNGLNSWCKICVNKDNKTRQHLYASKQKIYRKKYESKPSIKLKIKEEYQKNKIKIRERTELYRFSLKGKIISYKKSARKRNIEFLLTDEQCKEFYQKLCFYCNSPIPTLGIDRFENSKGYTIENCVPCCSKCNFMKHTMDYNDFKNQIEKIYKNLQNDL